LRLIAVAPRTEGAYRRNAVSAQEKPDCAYVVQRVIRLSIDPKDLIGVIEAGGTMLGEFAL
jgi:hypothetical protein